MNAGKSTALLQSNYNYHERGMETLLFLPKIDADSNDGKIHSRIGLTADAHSVDVNFNFFSFVSQEKRYGCGGCLWRLLSRNLLVTRDTANPRRSRSRH